jgi:hypothetical protein
MRMMFLAAGLVLAGISSASTAQAQVPSRDAFSSAFGPCRGNTCIIRSNPGGNVRQFVAAASEILRDGRRLVVIDGPCASACVIFADIARERVCITRNATFGFHKATVFRAERGSRTILRAVGRRDPVHSPDIASWVRRNGGFPARGMRVMSNDQAGQFWARCQIRR